MAVSKAPTGFRLCDLCLSERRTGKRKEVANTAKFRGRTREGIENVAMCGHHRRSDGIGPMETLW